MIEVHLHGAAARLLPERAPVALDVATPAEALTALRAVLPGFGELLRAGHWRITADEEEIALDAMDLRFGARRSLHLHPAAEGAGISGLSLIAIVFTAAAVVAGFLLAPKIDDYSTRDSDGQRDSYLFDGAVNTAAQGGVVPLIYGGPIRVGSTLVSAGIASERIND